MTSLGRMVEAKLFYNCGAGCFSNSPQTPATTKDSLRMADKENISVDTTRKTSKDIIEIVINHWMRTTCNMKLIADILKIMLEFSPELFKDEFDASIGHSNITFRDEGKTASFSGWDSDEENEDLSVYGTYHAKSGGKYHWKFQSSGYVRPIIGITEISTRGHCRWWYYSINGYGYSGHGYPGSCVYHNEQRKAYGNGSGVIEVTLDLKCNNNQLSYVINGKDYGKAFDVSSDCEYKCGVQISSRGGSGRGSVKLLSFHVE